MPPIAHLKNWFKGKKDSKESSPLSMNDITVGDPRDTDLIIPVIGPAGSGKSTFINVLLERDVASVGHDLTVMPHTTRLHPHIFSDAKRRRVIVVDTPGLLDLTKDDRDLLRHISRWLASSYGADMKIAGIIYVYEIIQSRVRTVPPSLDMIKSLCGPGAAQNVILATTKWRDVSREVGERREAELKGDYWQAMIKLGSTMCQFDETPQSARNVLNHILKKHMQ
ncbi:putative 50S ribosome-binding GTPase [Lyophyllum shimeji]|uniref:50S ribosome-binding GTPase n=1 Tax=Lyophyllum shimeji TaxID=47721 RepID=A0A9P3PPI1_LYOSH|nr:putative 50S ribosome-binding GTPase [Lyophyllum shimeji]